MDPAKIFCANADCPARGKAGEGNIKVHSKKEGRFRCTSCGKTFAATKGTPFYRLHEDDPLMVCVLVLLTHGCPVQAVVEAFDLDERTVASWRDKAGYHCKDVQDHFLTLQRRIVCSVCLDQNNRMFTQDGRC